jgi:ribosomal protein S18 acetylase RimI-like enzyme
MATVTPLATAPEPLAMARVELLSEPHFVGANKVFNDFIGGAGGGHGKVCCCCCACSNCPNSEDEFAANYRKHPELKETSAVALSDGKVIGSVKLVFHGQYQGVIDQCLHTPKKDEAYIDHLAVDASARGRGIGTEMLRWCEQTARARGAKVLTLGVVSGNPARRLYERFGFVQVSSGCCKSSVVYCLFGKPHGQFGGVTMEKRLD